MLVMRKVREPRPYWSPHMYPAAVGRSLPSN